MFKIKVVAALGKVMFKTCSQNVKSLKICQAHQRMSSENQAKPNKQVNSNYIGIILIALGKGIMLKVCCILKGLF